jgi:6-phosphogluconate dehydrogenase
MKSEFGMIGLGVMGANLALNIADRGFRVAVWNLEGEWTDRFVSEHGGSFTGTRELRELSAALERPRRIMMMIKAGAPVDSTLAALRPLLEPGDIVIDGGNSWFEETRRRTVEMAEAGLEFVGSGVSGGEEGARFGPSLMPGGSRDAWLAIKPVFEAIAARTESGPCVTWVGPDGAGHFVKMVHNGIEYGDMQLIAEAYEILRVVGGLDASRLAEVFAEWNRGALESFLIEITARIFTAKDAATGQPLVDMVLDKAGQKGTGKWTAQVALDLAVPIPTIAAAIDARVLSSMKEERLAASRVIGSAARVNPPHTGEQLIADVHDALLASKICAYAQGMSLIAAGSGHYRWGIDLGEIARIWKGGCIIRARLLDSIMRAYEVRPGLANLLLEDEIKSMVAAAEGGWRRAASLAQVAGVAAPAISASLAYFDSYRGPRLPQNLTQAQRDYFGSHLYQRVDDPEGAFVHTEWKDLVEE